MQLAIAQHRGFAASVQRRAVSPRCRRVGRLCVSSKLVLTPTGDGSTDHLDAAVPLPGAIELVDGLFELGRSDPADIVIPLPTVSTRHAMLRVANGASAGDSSVQVSDLGSTNGTFVDGEELAPMSGVALALGSTVVFGDKYLAAFRLDYVEEAPAAPAVPEVVEAAPAAAPEQ